MRLKRLQVIIIASLLALIGAAVPIAAMLQISRMLAAQTEEARLDQVAGQVIDRTNAAFAEARAALREIAEAQAAPCSDAHIALMRKLTVNTRAIDEMGYFRDGLLACTSWGRTQERIALTPGAYVTRDGIMVDVGVRPRVSGANARIALQYREHNVLLDPAQLVDVLAPAGMRLAIASDTGVLVGELNGPDPELVGSLLARPRTGMDARHLFAAVQRADWIAVATLPRDQMQASLQRQRMLLLPVGGFVAALIVGTVVWLSRKRLSPLGELGIAVRKREFIVHYQPIIALRTGICVGAEALVRWRRPDGSLVRPDFFIPLAEESGLILPITDQVVEAVIADLEPLLVADRSLHIAVNLSAEDIRTGRILDVIPSTLAPTDIRTQQIWLEATERGFVDIEAARETIARARRSGHSVAIDDFGTGYSSLQYLQGLPLDALKIDKSFIDTIGRNTATSAVTSHIIEMAKALKLFTVAEGVETQEQLDYLCAHGVDFAQGWFFAKPLPAKEFTEFYRRRKERYGSGPDVIQSAAA